MIIQRTKSKFAAIIFVFCGLIIIKFFAYPNNTNARYTKKGNLIISDLQQIKQRGKLVALTENSSTSYFVYKGEPMGYEYEMLNAFAKHIGVELEIVVVKDMNMVFDQLNRGEADIVAANLTVTKERSAIVNFTEPLLQTRQVLVQRKPDKWQRLPPGELDKRVIRNVVDLAGKTVHVRKESSFYQRLLNISEETGNKINISLVSGKYDTESLIANVAKGEIEYTVADENVGMINNTYYPNIDIRTPISFPQKIAWAVRKTSPSLLEELNEWLEKKRKTSHYTFLYNKYFRNSKEAALRAESDFFSKTGGKISIYDELIKKYSKKIEWDWRLLASMICQESRFNPEAQSWAGAYGLMQIIPATAVRYGIDTISATPLQSIQAGTSFILSLDKYWKDIIKDKKERTKFVLASYNVGLGHVIDARNLAIKYDKNPMLWDNNVADFVLQKANPRIYNDPVCKYGYCRGQEPFNYVKQILKRYEHYKNVIAPLPESEMLVKNN